MGDQKQARRSVNYETEADQGGWAIWKGYVSLKLRMEMPLETTEKSTQVYTGREREFLE